MKQLTNIEMESIVKAVLNFVEEDLRGLKYTSNINLVEDDTNAYKYIAYRIRAFMMKNCFAKRNAKNVTEKSNQSEDFEGLHEFLGGLYDADWIELNWQQINSYDFQSIYVNEKEIRDYLGFTQYDFFNLLKQFNGLSQDSEEFSIDYQATKDDLLPLFVEALNYALTKVDDSREIKEKVKYINKAMLTKFIELQMKRDGVKRIRKGNESTYVKVETNPLQDVWLVMFGKTIKNIGGIEAFALWLTPKQIKFVREVYSIIETDLIENNVDAFRWKENGLPVIKKRYLAEKMGMGETNFKQTLDRCKKKIVDNFAEVRGY